MYLSHQFSSQIKMSNTVNFFQPPLSFTNQHHQLIYLNNQNQLTTQIQFQPEQIHTPTKNKITAIQSITIKQAPFLAIGTEDLNSQFHLLIFDYLNKRIVNQINMQQQVQKIIQITDSTILLGCNDYVYCYQLSTSRTTSGYTEIFWVTINSKITDLFVVQQQMNKVTFITFSSDLYLRIFENDSLQQEVKTFTRTSINKVDYFYNYIAILTANNKFKLYYIQHDQQQQFSFKTLMSTDVNTGWTDFSFCFKPYAKQLEKYVKNVQDNYIEQYVQLIHPLPFVVFLNTKINKMQFQFINLEDQKLVFKNLMSTKFHNTVKQHFIQKCISEQDSFSIFMKQYVEGFELQNEELPFTVEQIKKDCRQFIITNDPTNSLVYEFPFIFDFYAVLGQIQDMEGTELDQYGIRVQLQQIDKEESDNNEQNENQAVLKPKKKKKSKSKQQQIIQNVVQQENSDYSKIIQIQNQLFNVKQQLRLQELQQQQIQLLTNSQLQLQFSDNQQLTSTDEKIQVTSYSVNFDGKYYLFNNQQCANAQQKQPSNLSLNSDVLQQNMQQFAQQSNINGNDFNQLSFIKKQLFMRKQPQYYLPTSTPQSNCSLIINFKQSNNLIQTQQLEFKCCILPSFKIIDFTKQINIEHNQNMSVVTITNVSEQQFKLLFQFQQITCQLESDYTQFTIQTALPALLQQCGVTIQTIDQFIYVHYDKANQLLYIRSEHFRALLVYTFVTQKSCKCTSQPTISLGVKQQQLFKELIEKKIILSKQAFTTHNQIQEQSTAIQFCVSDVNNRLSQRQFGDLFNQYDGVINKQFGDVSQLFNCQLLSDACIQNLNEYIQIYDGVNKEQSAKLLQKLGELFKNNTDQKYVDEWIAAWL